MAKYSAVKATVNAYIKQNGRKEITGRILNAVLNATIDSLGKYFQFAGGALPTDDPGTPDQNVCYLAGEPGVYTNFGGITIENEEVALLFWDGEWTKQRILIGIREVNASVDNQVGTPSVDVSYSGGELVLTFHNLKGEQGETGDPAGFGTIGADINGGVGTPGVSVETSGDNTAKNLMFHFTNLKGETGVTSVVATIDDTSGTPSCQVSLVGQQLTLAFSGLKGLKGDTGVSADYPITIYNGLDSDATDQALTAAQGKVLDGKVSQLGQELPLNLINKGVVSEWDGFSSVSNKFVSLIQGHTYKFAIKFQNSGLLGDYANVKLMTDTSLSSVKKIIDLANRAITAGDIVTAELLWSDASVENYSLGVYGPATDKQVFNGSEISVMDISIDITKQDVATNTARLIPIAPIGFISVHETDKIAITDSTITIPKNTRIVYGLNGFSYTATQSSATVINRDSNYEQLIVFNIGTKTIVGRGVNGVQTDDVILFLVQNAPTNKRKISLHPSLYTYDGKAPFVMQSEGLYKMAQILSDSEKTQVLTNLGIEWTKNEIVVFASYPSKNGKVPGVREFTNTYAITGCDLVKGHTYAVRMLAESEITAPSNFNLKIVNSSSDSTVLRIMALGGLTFTEKTAQFVWENETVANYRVGFYGNGDVNTGIAVYLKDITIDVVKENPFPWDVIARNTHKESAIVSIAAHQGNQAIKVADKFTLLHFSDVHGNTVNIADVVEYVKHYADFLDDAIHTGDSVQTQYSNPNPFELVQGAENILNVIGNHEAWLNTSDPDYYATEKQTYDKIFAPSIANWDVVQPTGAAENGYCYYYKDYSTAGFRLIVLDSVHWHYRNGVTEPNPTQKAWFESVLADAITNNLRVVCAMHYPPQNGIVPVANETGWNAPILSDAGGLVGDGWYASDEIFDCVDAFITAGGKFHGWIIGHTHEDFFGKVLGHTEQPIVVIGTANGSGYIYDKFVSGTVAQDNFNIITFENLNSKDYIKVVKMGGDCDVLMRSKKTICYNVTDGILVSTT